MRHDDASLFYLVVHAILVADRNDGRIRFANEKASEIFGLTPAQLLAARIQDLHPAGACPPLWPEGSSARHSLPQRVSVVRPDGSTVHCMLTIAAGIGSELSDWTGFYSVEDAPIDKVQMWRMHMAMLEQIPLAISLADIRIPDARIVYANAHFQRMSGYRIEEVIGSPTTFMFGNELSQDGYRTLLQAVQRRETSEIVRVRNYRKDGSPFWAEIQVMPVNIDREGPPTHYMVSRRDITAIVEAEDRMGENEERYRRLAEYSTDAIFNCHQSGTIIYASPAVRTLLGSNPDTLVGTNIQDLVHGDTEEFLNQLLLSRRGPRGGTFLCQLRASDGSLRWIEASGKPFVRHTPWMHNEIIIIARDASRRMEVESEMRKALLQEQEAAKLKSDFISMVSHEIRTPLTGITTSAHLLRDYGKQLPPESTNRNIDNILKSAARIRQLLEGVLFVGKSDSGSMAFKPAPCCPLRVAEDALATARTLDPAFKFHLEACPEASGQFMLDENLLQHCLQNLAANAVKYSGKSKLAWMRIRIEDDTLVFEVEDKGMGIPSTADAHIWDNFYRAENVGNITGTGLGLPIAKRATEAHGGTIGYTGAPGGGTLFIVRIPAPRVQPA